MRCCEILLLMVAGLLVSPALNASAVEPEELLARLDANGDGLLSAAEAGEDHRLLFERMLRIGDDDGDGQLDAAELTAALTPLRPERPTIEKQGSKLPGADELTVVVALLDANGDGRITRSEATGRWTPLLERMLAQADGNKNGQLDPREIAEGAVRLGTVAQLAVRRLGIDVAAELAKLKPDERSRIERMGDLGQGGVLADPARAAEAFDQLDADGDGFIGADEVPAQLAERFGQAVARADRDGDGKLSRREWLAISRRLAASQQPPADPQATRQTVRRLLNRFDRNGDGRLTEAEAPPRLAENFARADADGDGQLGPQELARIAEMLQQAGRGQRPAPPATPRSEAGQPSRTDDQSS